MTKSIIDDSRSITDNSRSITDNSRSITDNSRSIIDKLKWHSKFWCNSLMTLEASFNHHNILILQATGILQRRSITVNPH
jgi:hypothetical protein